MKFGGCESCRGSLEEVGGGASKSQLEGEARAATRPSEMSLAGVLGVSVILIVFVYIYVVVIVHTNIHIVYM